MRQSLSEPTPVRRGSRPTIRTLFVAITLSAALAAVAAIDQFTVQSLSDHAVEMYAPYGERPSNGLLYGLLYAVAGLGVLLWSAVLRTSRSSLFGAVAALAVAAVTAALGLTLLTVTEYGTRLFPLLWGILAVLPSVAGIVAAVLMLRRAPVSGGSA
jgi:hypothetical protein